MVTEAHKETQKSIKVVQNSHLIYEINFCGQLMHDALICKHLRVPVAIQNVIYQWQLSLLGPLMLKSLVLKEVVCMS